MKTTTFKFPEAVLVALEKRGDDIDRINASVITALNRGKAGEEKSKLGSVRLQKSFAKWTESVSTSFTGNNMEVGIRFANFCNGVATIQKHHGQNWEIQIPNCFIAWLNKHNPAFLKVEAEELAKKELEKATAKV